MLLKWGGARRPRARFPARPPQRAMAAPRTTAAPRPLPQLRPLSARANGGPRAPPPRGATRPVFVCLSSAAAPLPPPHPPPAWFPSPRSHQPLVLITQSESQRIQPESRVKGASGSAGKGQKESGEGGGEAAVGFILSFPGVGRSPPRGAVPPGPSRLPDPSERTPGPSTGQPRPPPPFKFPSCRRWAAPGFRRPAAPGKAAQAGERPGTASARRSAARGGRAALGRPHKGTSVRAGGPPDVFAARSSCGF